MIDSDSDLPTPNHDIGISTHMMTTLTEYGGLHIVEYLLCSSLVVCCLLLLLLQKTPLIASLR